MAFRVPAFRSLTLKTSTKEGICGWYYLESYRGLGVERGSLLVNGTDAEPSGDPQVVDSIHAILLPRYPYVEITLILSMVVGLAVAILVGCILLRSGPTVMRRSLWERIQRNPKKRRLAPLLKLSRRSPEILQSSSKLLQLPTKLHLEILSYLEYHDLRRMRASCGFYHDVI
jgi:hypothetical protein